MAWDGELIGLVDSASVCCGAHAGSRELSMALIRECRARGVEVGAHPGYPDPANFGRVDMDMTIDRLEEVVGAQLEGIAPAGPLAYLKPHGALYHRATSDSDSAALLCRLAASYRMAVVGSPRSRLQEEAAAAGVGFRREGFADRGYGAGGALLPRGRPGALLTPTAAARQALALARSGGFDTLCVHGDSPAALRTARAVRAALRREAGRAPGPDQARK